MKTYDMPQQSPEWLHKKKGVVSGTQAKGIMGTAKARQDAIYDIVGEALKVGVDTEYENPIDRGNRLEPEAAAAYEMETGNHTTKVGFCESDKNTRIGNSPDRFVGDDGAIEIKCPEHKNYIKYWLTNEVPDDYIWQVVQYFVVNEKLQWLDFVSYNPDIPVHPIHIVRVTRFQLMDKIIELEQKEQQFIAEVNAILETIIKF
jgi:putative phage-type endonuclease